MSAQSSAPPAPPIGFVGLGQMGGAIARRLVALGHDVRGWDLSAQACERAAAGGVTLVGEVSDISRDCPTVLICLPSSHEVRAHCVAEGGLFAEGTTHEGQVQHVIDLTSGDPSATPELVESLRVRGIAYVDSPVSGSGGDAAVESGDLTLFVGADEQTFEQVRPLLEQVGSRVRLMGPTGSGHISKSLNNLLAAAGVIATAEVVVAGMKFGIDPRALVSAIQESSGRNFSTEHRFPQFVLKGDFSASSGGKTSLLEKDCAQAVSFARSVDAPMPAGGLVAELVRIAAATYGGDEASLNIARLIGEWGGVRFGVEAS